MDSEQLRLNLDIPAFQNRRNLRRGGFVPYSVGHVTNDSFDIRLFVVIQK